MAAWIEPGQMLAIALRVLVQEVLRQERDVLAAIAERRQVDLDRIEAEQQILAELAGRRPPR